MRSALGQTGCEGSMMHEGARPLISTIVPVYNGERYLAAALESILGQRYRPIELIVVNDGSTDDSAEVSRKYASQVRYLYQPHAGAGAARNAGVDLATGAYFAFIDADDLWPPDRLERQMEALDADGTLDIVYGHMQPFISPELPDAVKVRLRCPPGNMPSRLPGTMLIRRDAFFRVGYFGSAIGEAVDWAMRATELDVKGTMLSAVVLKRRVHATNRSVLTREARSEYVKYVKASLDRRRARNCDGE